MLEGHYCNFIYSRSYPENLFHNFQRVKSALQRKKIDVESYQIDLVHLNHILSGRQWKYSVCSNYTVPA